MNTNYLSGEEFTENLRSMPLDQRIWFMKALELYFNETQNDQVDEEKMIEWLRVTDPKQIEAQHLPRDLRRALARLEGNKQATH
jgi:uncharacterized membrane protein